MKRLILLVKVFRCFVYDFLFYIKHSLTIVIVDNKNYSEAHIMLLMHSLEKGLSLSQKKYGWGKDKSISLVQLITKHIDKYGENEVTNVAISILNAYLNDEFSTKDKTAIEKIKILCNNHQDTKTGGVKEVRRPQFNLSYEDIFSFFNSRISVRDYSSLPITDEEYKKVVEMGKTTPTACNRQSSRVYVYRDKNLIGRLLDNQLGDQGWCGKASTLFVITANINYFGGTYERHQALIDGGMYAMSFMMGLHAQKIASCFKMFVREPKREKEFKKLANIANEEMPVVLILAGHYLENITLSPKSHRLATNNILKQLPLGES